MPHHVTQRGNRRQQTFFNDDDYQSYQMLMSEWCKEYGVELEKNGVIFYQNIRMKLYRIITKTRTNRPPVGRGDIY